MESIGVRIAHRQNPVVLDPREVDTDLAIDVIVKVRRRNGDDLSIDALAIHVGNAQFRIEDAVGERAKTFPSRVLQILQPAVFDQYWPVFMVGLLHLDESIRNDGMGVEVNGNF